MEIGVPYGEAFDRVVEHKDVLACIGKRFIKRDLAADSYAVNRPDIIEIVEQHVSTIARPSDPFFY